jgi:hypothetical protein
MRDVLVLALIVAVAVLGYLLHTQSTMLKEQQHNIQELGAKIEARSRTASLDLQGKCSKQAWDTYDQSGWKKEQMASFTNHYNEKMNKCFILIQNTTQSKPFDGTFFNYKVLMDAFEGKSYGEYDWQSDKAKKYWEVAPFLCKGTLLSGEEKACHSANEFDEIVKLYME